MRDLIRIVESAGMQTVEVYGRSVKVWKNPTHSAFASLLTNFGPVLRGTIDDKGDLYVWDAAIAIHVAVEEALGLWGHYHFRLMLRSDCVNVEDNVDENELSAQPALLRAYGNWDFSIENDSVVDDDDDDDV